MKIPASARNRKRRLRKGRGLFLFALGALFDAVVDGFSTFLFGAALFVAFPTGFFLHFLAPFLVVFFLPLGLEWP